MKFPNSALLFSIAIIVASFILGNAYLNKYKKSGSISVTGLGTTDFSSDLIVWEGSFQSQNIDLKEAFASIEQDKGIIENYLLSRGVNKDEIIFGAVMTDKKMKVRYSQNGNYMGEDFEAYLLRRTVKIESKDIDKIENISREVTELLNKGVNFYSNLPRYYYTKLADLKINLISRATEDAKLRADRISEFSGAELGKLNSAKMGVFQITGQNSNENYSWGGAFNTLDREKTASITMKLNYSVK